MKPGEHLILGFKGFTLPDWVEQFARSYGLGGIILFDYDCQTRQYRNNIETASQLQSLCQKIHALPGRPLVFIDQEGGKVRRLKEKLGFAPLASAQAAESLSDAEYLRQLTHSFEEQRALGIDVDLMPVIDLNTNPQNPNIGAVERSYSADPSRVRRAVDLCDRAGRATGIQLCLKHYPGLGGAQVDSHQELTDISGTVGEAQLALFDEWAPRLFGGMTLVSHGIMKEWEAGMPISMSAQGLSRLRKAASQGVLISDDLQMQGLQRKMSTAQGAVAGLKAGLDLICIGNNLLDEQKKMPKVAERIAEEAEQDAGLAEHLRRSSLRIADRKRRAAAPEQA
jgi:beta-N-acetylhexosaminidase